MTPTNLVIFCTASALLGFVLYGHKLESRAFLTAPIVCLLIGVALGPYGFALTAFDATGPEGRDLLHQLARLVLAFTIMAAALRLEEGFIAANWRSLAVILTLGMALMWGASALAFSLLPVSFATALLLGAIVAPTDPVLASTVVSGKIAATNVPARLRGAIMAESAANDGLGLPFVVLAMTLLGGSLGWGEFVLRVVLWEVVGAAILGVLLGLFGGWLYSVAREHHSLTSEALLPTLVTLPLVVLAAVKLIGGDGILAVFAAGLVFRPFAGTAWAAARDSFGTLVDRLVTPAFFILLGAMLPIGAWVDLGVPLLGATIAVLALRRLPAWLLLAPLTPIYRRAEERVFAGWFGPIGVAAIFYATLAAREADASLAVPVTSAVVVASIFVHGLTSTPLGRRLHRAEDGNG